jgi:hypothetical protein
MTAQQARGARQSTPLAKLLVGFCLVSLYVYPGMADIARGRIEIDVNARRERACEIAEIKRLLNEVEASLHYQIVKTQRIRLLVFGLERSLQRPWDQGAASSGQSSN